MQTHAKLLLCLSEYQATVVAQPSLSARCRAMRASRTSPPHNSDWPLAVVERVFDEAFGASACIGDEAPEQQALPVDMVEYSPDGLRMSFSLRTAEWLTSVTESPRDFGLVYNFLVEALSTSSHPLGRLMDRFVSVMEASFGSSADSHALAVYGAAEERTRLSARCMKLAVGRLHEVVGTVLPPLHNNPGRSFALAAVEAVVFERCSDLLRMLLGGTLGHEDDECESRLSELRHMLPRDFGARAQFWLEEEGDARAPTAEAAEARLPYASAIALVQSLPLLAAPRQKLQLFCDSCTEAARCVARHHQARAAHGGAGGSCGEQGSRVALGAEDLIPVMAYVLVRAGLRGVSSQLRFIEVFVDCPSWEAALLGPLGYGLATLEAATQLMRHLSMAGAAERSPSQSPQTPQQQSQQQPSPEPAAASLDARVAEIREQRRPLRERARLAARRLRSSLAGLVPEDRRDDGGSNGEESGPEDDGLDGQQVEVMPGMAAGCVQAVLTVEAAAAAVGGACGGEAEASEGGGGAEVRFGGCASGSGVGGAWGGLSESRKMGQEPRTPPSIPASPAPRSPVPRIWARSRPSPNPALTLHVTPICVGSGAPLQVPATAMTSSSSSLPSRTGASDLTPWKDITVPASPNRSVPASPNSRAASVPASPPRLALTSTASPTLAASIPPSPPRLVLASTTGDGATSSSSRHAQPLRAALALNLPAAPVLPPSTAATTTLHRRDGSPATERRNGSPATERRNGSPATERRNGSPATERSSSGSLTRRGGGRRRQYAPEGESALTARAGCSEGSAPMPGVGASGAEPAEAGPMAIAGSCRCSAYSSVRSSEAEDEELAAQRQATLGSGKPRRRQRVPST